MLIKLHAINLKTQEYQLFLVHIDFIKTVKPYTGTQKDNIPKNLFDQLSSYVLLRDDSGHAVRETINQIYSLVYEERKMR